VTSSSVNHRPPHRHRVGLLVQTASEWSRLVLRGVAEYAHEYGPWDFYIEPRGVYELVDLPDDWTGDGLIVRLTSSELAEAIHRSGLPAVNVSWLGKHSRSIPKVVSDEAACGRLAAEHLAERNFRSFGYVGPIGRPGYADLLGKAFCGWLDEAGLPVERFGNHRELAEKHLYQVREDLKRWLTALPKPLGLLAWSSETGREITASCEETGHRVPDDVATLCAEHDILMSSLAPVPLSNIDQSPRRVGYEAAALLDRLMKGDAPPADPLLIPPLGVVQRQSTETWAVDDPLVARALRFIRDNAHEPIQVVDVRKAVNVSRRVLEHRFAHVLGRTPAAEIRRARLELVKRMLLETDLAITRVAERCGFNHPEVMIRCFRREVGVSPGQFRSRR
jgi:LacI family transcriptional regulator